MSEAEFTRELKAMPEVEREEIFASFLADPECREDLVDLMIIAERRDEPVRPIEEVFRDLKIDA